MMWKSMGNNNQDFTEVKTIEEIRNEIGAFLTKPLVSDASQGESIISSTDVESGGLSGKFILKNNAEIIILDKQGRYSVHIAS